MAEQRTAEQLSKRLTPDDVRGQFGDKYKALTEFPEGSDAREEWFKVPYEALGLTEEAYTKSAAAFETELQSALDEFIGDAEALWSGEVAEGEEAADFHVYVLYSAADASKWGDDPAKNLAPKQKDLLEGVASAAKEGKRSRSVAPSENGPDLNAEDMTETRKNWALNDALKKSYNDRLDMIKKMRSESRETALDTAARNAKKEQSLQKQIQEAAEDAKEKIEEAKQIPAKAVEAVAAKAGGAAQVQLAALNERVQTYKAAYDKAVEDKRKKAEGGIVKILRSCADSMADLCAKKTGAEELAAGINAITEITAERIEEAVQNAVEEINGVADKYVKYIDDIKLRWLMDKLRQEQEKVMRAAADAAAKAAAKAANVASSAAKKAEGAVKAKLNM